MGLDEFKSDNPLSEDPPNEDKWRYEEPGVPQWERQINYDEELIDSDSTIKRIVLSIANPNVKFIQDQSEAWISSRLHIDIRSYR